MKTKILIVLMLFSLSSFAQTNQDINWDSINSTINLDYVQWDGTDTLYFSPVLTESESFLWSYPFAQFLFAYEVECYNDSVYVTHWTLDSIKIKKTGWMKINDSGRKTYQVKGWRHKEPTFSGFTQWLRKNFVPEITGFQINVSDKVFKIDLPIREEKQYNLDSLATQTVRDLNKVKWREEKY